MIGKKPAGSLSLAERIEQIRRDAEAFIAERVAEDKKKFPGLPLGTIENCLIGGVGDCKCRQVLHIIEQNTAG